MKFANTVSPPPSPKFHILEGTAKFFFSTDAPTSSPQTSDQVSANDDSTRRPCTNPNVAKSSVVQLACHPDDRSSLNSGAPIEVECAREQFSTFSELVDLMRIMFICIALTEGCCLSPDRAVFSHHKKARHKLGGSLLPSKKNQIKLRLKKDNEERKKTKPENGKQKGDEVKAMSE